MNYGSLAIKLMLGLLASSMTTYYITKLLRENKDVFRGYLTGLIIGALDPAVESPPSRSFEEQLSGVEESKIIMAHKGDGTNFWSKFSQEEWDMLIAYQEQSGQSLGETITEVMEGRLENGKVQFGFPDLGQLDDDEF
jgi:hypothetical protein